jgi:DNA-binding MarR family transcriptional regulator
MGEHSDPRFHAWYGALQGTLRSLNLIERHVEAATGLPLASIETLVNIGMQDDGRMRMSELADTLLLSRGGATRQVARLEEAGYVERQIPPDDRRATYAVITGQGREMVDRAVPVLEEAAARHYLDLLTEDELAAIRSASVKLLEQTEANCEWLVGELRATTSGADA